MEDKIIVTLENEKRECPQGITLHELAKEVKDKYDYDIVLASVDGKLSELAKPLVKNTNVSFLTTQTVCGSQAYKRSATLLMLKAFYNVSKDNNCKVVVRFSLSKGLFCTYEGEETLNQELLDKVKDEMNNLVKQDYTIKKKTLSTDVAVEHFAHHHMHDKEKLFRYRRSSRVNVYSLNGYEDYFYGYMVPSTGYIKYFDLYLYDDGFVLQLPERSKPTIVPAFEPQNNIYDVLRETERWNSMIGTPDIGTLNESISKGNMNDLILVQEALQEKKIADIAEMISKRKDVKFVMIAGPSSSGKTTFSHRLSIQLRAHGLKPHPIAVDNYFVDRELSPRDENGDYNFEALEALDVEQFNKDMTALSNGEEVLMPTYNFVTGRREYKGNKLKLEDGDILVIEGIHCLNDKLSYSLDKESKFKIYISALTTLNIDEHNRIPTTDGRLLRRMVRDARTRGTTAAETIARWPSVRKGEENHIFPFQHEADVVFNSALVYELAALKLSAEPLLFDIKEDSPEYLEAKRLLKFLDYFLGISNENIPMNSLVREFIGGGCFKV